MSREQLGYIPLELKEKHPGLIVPTSFHDLSYAPKSKARARLHESGLCSLPTTILTANQATSDILRQGTVKSQMDELLLVHCPDLEEHPGLVVRTVNGGKNGYNYSLPWLVLGDVGWSSADRKISEFVQEQSGKQLMVHLEHPVLQKKVHHVRIGYNTSSKYSVQIRNSSHARQLENNQDQLETSIVGHMNQFFSQCLPNRSLLRDSYWLDQLLETLREDFPDNFVCEIRVYANGNTQVIAVD